MSTPATQPTWQDECHRAAAMFEAGDHQGALDIFSTICNRPDLDSSSKTMMYYNVATICEKMGNHDGSMKAFHNARHCSLQQYLYIEQARAVYLIRVNRHEEAASLIEHLLKHDSLTREARDACESNLKIARQLGKPSAATGTARYSEAPRASF